MQIEHGHAVEDAGRNDPSVSNHYGQLDVGRHHVFHGMRYGNSQFGRGNFHRAGRDATPSASATIRSGNAQHHVMSGRHEGT